MDMVLALRIFNILIAIVSIIIWVIFYKNNKNIGAIAPISWLFNFLAFSTWRFLNPSNSIEILVRASWWTGLLCTHAIILLLVSALMSDSTVKIKRE